jgi:hypothetical protein
MAHMIARRAAGSQPAEDVEVDAGFEPALSVGGGLAGQEVVARRMLIHGGNSIGIGIGNFSVLELSDSRVTSKKDGVISEGTAQIRRSRSTRTSTPSPSWATRAASSGSTSTGTSRRTS